MKRFMFYVLVGFLITGCSKPGVIWEPYDEALIKQAAENGQPVVIDFFAEWCVPCHQLEATTYADPRVIAALDGFVRLKIDATEAEDPEVLDLLTKYEVPGLPMIIFYDSQGNELYERRIPGYADADEFLALIEGID